MVTRGVCTDFDVVFTRGVSIQRKIERYPAVVRLLPVKAPETGAMKDRKPEHGTERRRMTTMDATLENLRVLPEPESGKLLVTPASRCPDLSAEPNALDAESCECCLTILYDTHADSVFRFMVGMLGRREDAEDAVQAVWTKLARRPEGLARAEEPTAYLWASARHHVASALRRRALERLWTRPSADDAEIPIPEGPGLSIDQRRDLGRAVAKLRPKLRAIVLLVGFAGCTLEESAQRLGIPRGTAASRYHAAIEKLRRFLHPAR